VLVNDTKRWNSVIELLKWRGTNSDGEMLDGEEAGIMLPLMDNGKAVSPSSSSLIARSTTLK
jgi:hypothetical protein